MYQKRKTARQLPDALPLLLMASFPSLSGRRALYDQPPCNAIHFLCSRKTGRTNVLFFNQS